MKFKELRHGDFQHPIAPNDNGKAATQIRHLQSLNPIPHESTFSLGMHATIYIPSAIVVHHAAKEALAFQLFQRKVR